MYISTVDLLKKHICPSCGVKFQYIAALITFLRDCNILDVNHWFPSGSTTTWHAPKRGPSYWKPRSIFSSGLTYRVDRCIYYHEISLSSQEGVENACDCLELAWVRSRYKTPHKGFSDVANSSRQKEMTEASHLVIWSYKFRKAAALWCRLRDRREWKQMYFYWNLFSASFSQASSFITPASIFHP